MVKNDGLNESFLSENEYYVQSNQHVQKLQVKFNSTLDWSGGMLLDLRSKQTLHHQQVQQCETCEAHIWYILCIAAQTSTTL